MTSTTLKRILILGAVSCVLAAPARAALSPEDETTIREVRQETRDLVESIKSYTADQRDEAIQEIEIAIIRLDNRIESLEMRIEARWEDMTRPARNQARESLDALHRQRKELTAWYDNLKTSSASAWADIRRGFSRAYSDINKAWEEALNEFADSDSS